MKLIQDGGVPVQMWVDGVNVEPEAEAQLLKVSRVPVVGPHVAVMPDVHLGIGATIGSVIPTYNAIIPAAVGVDLGCGVSAVQTTLTAEDLPDNLADLRSAIEAAVPHGRTNNGAKGDRGAWGDTPKYIGKLWANQYQKTYEALCTAHPKIRAHNTVEHLGTLGGGNHFIEICLDKSNKVWVMLHSGSRGMGNRIGSYFIELAKEDMRAAHGDMSEDLNLCYLTEGTEHFDDYRWAVGLAQDFAADNRFIMMDRVLQVLQAHVDPVLDVYEHSMAVSCHHNYVQKETHFGLPLWITRKGAVRAGAGELGVIPGSMGDRSYIVRGKGNADSYCSCSHGAGRAMSRAEARRRFDVSSHKIATSGIECRKDEGVIDETPDAYKPIDDVMKAQSDLVEVVAELKQVLCVKG